VFCAGAVNANIRTIASSAGFSAGVKNRTHWPVLVVVLVLVLDFIPICEDEDEDEEDGNCRCFAQSF
jgi:hypothetical protein